MTTELQQALLRVADASCGCTLGTAGYNAVENEGLSARVNAIVALLPPEVRALYDTRVERDLNSDGTTTRGEQNSIIIAAALQLKDAGLLDDDLANDRPNIITPQTFRALVDEQLQKINTATQR